MVEFICFAFVCFGILVFINRIETKKQSKQEKIQNEIKEAFSRVNRVCDFQGEISREKFYVMVNRGGRGIKRLIQIYAIDSTVYGVFHSQSGISESKFEIDFNDYGELTGRYRITTDNHDSNIPEIVAERIARQIFEYPRCLDDSFLTELYHMEVREGIRKPTPKYCSHCGKRIQKVNAKFCMYCGSFL